MADTNFFGGEFFGGGFFGGEGGSVAPPIIGGGIPSQGYSGHEVRHRTKDEIRKDREKFGVIPKRVEEIIERVAERQALEKEHDKQKHYDELIGELRLENIQVESYYLDALSAERERLIGEQIQRIEDLRIQVEIQASKDLKALLLIAQQLEQTYREVVLNALASYSAQVDEAIQKTAGVIRIFQQTLDEQGEKAQVKSSKDQEVQDKFMAELEQIMQSLKAMK